MGLGVKLLYNSTQLEFSQLQWPLNQADGLCISGKLFYTHHLSYFFFFGCPSPRACGAYPRPALADWVGDKFFVHRYELTTDQSFTRFGMLARIACGRARGIIIMLVKATTPEELQADRDPSLLRRPCPYEDDQKYFNSHEIPPRDRSRKVAVGTHGCHLYQHLWI